jgi:Peptidase A4 family
VTASRLRAGPPRSWRLPIFVATSFAVLAFTASSASAWTPGGLLHLAPQASGNTNVSNNWFGYNQGALERRKLFHSVAAQWTVPTATQHTAGQAEASSDWIGIGGGCVNANCLVTDGTLIQTGTEQDVSSSGATSYDAWFEVIPAPELVITSMTIRPGDRMSASVSEVVANSNIWRIRISDLTNGQSFSKIIPYSSTHATAEWIEETPLEIGTNAGLAALPNLTTPAFDNATVNGAPAGLRTSEQIDLVDSKGNVIGTPSAPDAEADGFNACTWATTCAAP